MIERLTAPSAGSQQRGLAQRAINRYSHQTMIKAKTVLDLLDGSKTTEQLLA